MKHLGLRSKEELFEIIEMNIHPARLTPLSYYFSLEALRRHQEAGQVD